MSSSSAQAAADGQSRPALRQKSLSELPSTAWPLALTLAAALLYALGYAFDRGAVRALGLWNLSRPTFTQYYLFQGGITLEWLAPSAAVLIVAFTLVHRPVNRAVAESSGRGKSKLASRIEKIVQSVEYPSGSIALISWLAVTVLLGAVSSGLPALDSTPLAATPALHSYLIHLRPDGSYVPNLELFFPAGGFVVIFIALNHWFAASAIRGKMMQTIYLTCVAVPFLSLLMEYAYIYGAASAIQPYALVTFSRMNEVIGDRAAAMLLGSDDHQFAFLVVTVDTTKEQRPEPHKLLVYVPRSEVKWMKVLSSERLETFADLRNSQKYVPR